MADGIVHTLNRMQLQIVHQKDITDLIVARHYTGYMLIGWCPFGGATVEAQIAMRALQNWVGENVVLTRSGSFYQTFGAQPYPAAVGCRGSSR